MSSTSFIVASFCDQFQLIKDYQKISKKIKLTLTLLNQIYTTIIKTLNSFTNKEYNEICEYIEQIKIKSYDVFEMLQFNNLTINEYKTIYDLIESFDKDVLSYDEETKNEELKRIENMMKLLNGYIDILNKVDLNEIILNQTLFNVEKFNPIDLNKSNHIKSYEPIGDLAIKSNDLLNAFINSTFEKGEETTAKARALKIVYSFDEVNKKKIKRYLNKANKYRERLNKIQNYPNTPEEIEMYKEYDKQNGDIYEYIRSLKNYIIEKKEKETKETINNLFKAFDIIFNDFIKIRSFYKQFLSTTNPSRFKSVADIFILKGINYETQKDIFMKQLKHCLNNKLFENLIYKFDDEIERIREKVEGQTLNLLYSQLKKIDTLKNEFKNKFYLIKSNIDDDLTKIDNETHEKLREQMEKMTPEELKDNEDYEQQQHKEIIKNIMKSKEIEEVKTLLKMIFKAFNKFSHEKANDHNETPFYLIIEDYEKLNKNISKLINDYIKTY